MASGHVGTATNGLKDWNPDAVTNLLAFSHSTKSGQPSVPRVSSLWNLPKKHWVTKPSVFSERPSPLMHWDEVNVMTSRSSAEHLFSGLYYLYLHC